MTKIKVYNLEGKEMEDLKLDDSVFGVPANNDLVHQVYVSLSANRRQILADTKTRGERAGSGIKPWRQKGTGRARVGSVRSPIWRKGGVIFGPTSERNFKKKINKKMNAKGIAITLSGKVRDNQLLVVDSFVLKERKTKKIAEALKNLKLKGSVLIGLSQKETETSLACRNMPNVMSISSRQLNVLEILNNKNLIISKESVKLLENKLKK
mgnify:FL=1